MWEQQIANGLTTGVVYALIAMGFSLVWATARTMNFAYGVTYTVGAYALVNSFLLLFTDTGMSAGSLILALSVTAIFGAALGFLLELSVFRPLRHSELAPYFCSFGVAIALESTLGRLFGNRPLIFNLGGARDFFDIGSITITFTQVIVLTSAALIMLGLHLMLRYTMIGRAMRAIAWDREAAMLMGVKVNRILALVFVISSIIAAWAGAFVGLFYGIITPYMGGRILSKGLAAAIFGGFGSIPGSIIGGLLLGILEAVGSGLTTSGNWPDVVSFSGLILVILVRPQGIFGRPEAMK